jgi:peptidoglycan hydrolase-like protein with peptidoglycan-binding domain
MAAQGALTVHVSQTGGFWNNGVSGQWTSQNDSGIRSIQTFFGLQVDGCVGPQTWGVLRWRDVNYFYLGNNGGSTSAWGFRNTGAPWRWFGSKYDPCYEGTQKMDNSSGATSFPFAFGTYWRVIDNVLQGPDGYAC